VEKEEFVDSAKDWGCVWSRKKAAVNILLTHCFFPSTSKCIEEEEEGVFVVERKKNYLCINVCLCCSVRS